MQVPQSLDLRFIVNFPAFRVRLDKQRVRRIRVVKSATVDVDPGE
jgi:hypothetical protein